MLPDFERADRIGEFWGYPESRAFAELLIDCEDDRTLRAVLIGMVAGGRRLGWEQRTGTRLRAAASIRANTRVSEFEWSDPEPRSLMYSASGDRGGARPLAEKSRPSPVLQIAPQARVPRPLVRNTPCARMSGWLRAVLVGMLRDAALRDRAHREPAPRGEPAEPTHRNLVDVESRLRSSQVFALR